MADIGDDRVTILLVDHDDTHRRPLAPFLRQACASTPFHLEVAEAAGESALVEQAKAGQPDVLVVCIPPSSPDSRSSSAEPERLASAFQNEPSTAGIPIILFRSPAAAVPEGEQSDSPVGEQSDSPEGEQSDSPEGERADSNPHDDKAEGELYEVHSTAQLMATLRLLAKARTAQVLAAEQRNLLEVTLASIGDAVLSTDKLGQITYLNPAAAKITGLDRQAALGQRASEAMQLRDALHHGPFSCPITAVLQENSQPVSTPCALLRNPQGEERLIEATTSPLRKESGMIDGAVMVFRDITERQRAELSLTEHNRMVSLRADVSVALATSEPLKEVLDTCAAAIVHHLDASVVRIWILNDEQQVFELQTSSGDYTDQDDYYRSIPMGQHKIGRIGLSRQPYLTNDVTHDPNIHDLDWARREGLVAFAGYPLLVEERVVGVVALFAKRRLSEGVLTDLAPLAEGIAQYIDRKRAEDRVKASEARYRGLADVSPQSVWMGRPEGEVTYINQYWTDLTGLDSRSSLGQGWLTAVAPEHRDRLLEALRDTIGAIDNPSDSYHQAEHDPTSAIGINHEVEIQLRRQCDQEYRWHLARFLPLQTELPHGDRWIGIALDIHDRKIAEAALRNSERQFRAMANSIPQLAWIAEPQGDIIWYNQRWYDYTGTTFEEMQGWGWQSVHDPKELPRVVAKFKRCLATQENWEDTFPLRRHDGEMRWHLSRMMPLRDESGNIIFYFGTNTDITDQREMEQALRDSDNRKDEFLAMLGHELRNPLAGIVTGVQVLGMLGLRSEAAQMQAVIERQATHMSRIVDDLLDVSRIARSKLALRENELDLRELVRTTVEDYRDSQILDSCDLRHELEDHPAWVHGDATRLAQVIANLIHNSCKFCNGPNEVVVRLATQPDERTATITVSDRGIGMSCETLKGIFDPFSQFDASIDRARGGLGLGLALVKGIVELHGGAVEAASDGPGKGSTFRVTLPLVEKRDAAEQDEESSNTAPQKVLVIDDRRDAILPVRQMLQMMGHEVVTASDGPSGIVSASEFLPDIVLCDIGLSDHMTGHDVAKIMRSLPDLKKVYLVAVTGYGQEEDRTAAKQAGFDFHLTKPVSRDKLGELLRHRPRFETAEQRV